MDDSEAGKTPRRNGTAAYDNLNMIYFIVVVGYGCLCGWELTFMFCPVLPSMRALALEVGVACYVGALAICAATAFVLWKKADVVLEKRRQLLPAGSALLLVAVALLALVAVFADAAFSIILAVAAWVLIGVGQAFVLVYWGTYLSLIPPARTAISTSIGSIIGTFLFVMVASLGNVWLNLFGTAFLIAVALVAAGILASALPSGTVLPAQRYNKNPPFSKPSIFSAVLHSIAYGFILIALFSFGLIPALIGAASGILGALLSLLWRSIDTKRGLEATRAQYAALPIIVGGLLLMPFFDEPGQIACCCAINAAHAFYRASNSGALAVATYEFQLQPVRQAAFGRVPILVGWFLGALLGFLVFFVLHLTGTAFALTTTVMVIVVVSAVSLHGLFSTKGEKLIRAHMIIDESLNAAPASTERLAQAEGNLAEIAEMFGLSPRETEVFELLARGRNAEHIQKKLVLAPGTVKTHIYHIYQKTGVNSQQRLMDRVEELMDERASVPREG